VQRILIIEAAAFQLSRLYRNRLRRRKRKRKLWI